MHRVGAPTCTTVAPVAIDRSERIRTTAADHAAWAALLLAYLLLIVALGVIGLNPGTPSLAYALLWFGEVAIARGAAALVAWASVAIDLALLFVCVFGLEIGGLLVAPSIVAFTIADALRRERTPAG